VATSITAVLHLTLNPHNPLRLYRQQQSTTRPQHKYHCQQSQRRQRARPASAREKDNLETSQDLHDDTPTRYNTEDHPTSAVMNSTMTRSSILQKKGVKRRSFKTPKATYAENLKNIACTIV
jgi:hypothetical protein